MILQEGTEAREGNGMGERTLSVFMDHRQTEACPSR